MPVVNVSHAYGTPLAVVQEDEDDDTPFFKPELWKDSTERGLQSMYRA